MRSRSEAEELDRRSPLAGRRELFDLPDGVVYLDGNSLGPMRRGLPDHLAATLGREWGQGLIRSWNPLPEGGGSWLELPARVGDLIAPLIGVGRGEVTVGDSTSVCLFRVLVAAMRLRPGRDVLVMEAGAFPTDLYVAEGVVRLLGGELRVVAGDPREALDDSVAAVCLTHVDFRTGARFDLDAVTAAVHESGAVMIWDLCHSAGAMQLDVGAADFAVGCTYKYLNGGPGSPAFTWVHPAHLPAVDQPITGWMGHRAPFDMAPDFAPVEGIGRMASGTPPVIGLLSLEYALGAFAGVDPADLRSHSWSLTSMFLDGLDELGLAEAVVTPRDERRGSQVSFRHPHAYGLVQALIARGVVGDYRDDGERDGIARFGFAPLVLKHTDVLAALEQLRLVTAREEYADPAYSSRNAVT